LFRTQLVAKPLSSAGAGTSESRSTMFRPILRMGAGKCWNDGMASGESCILSRTCPTENPYPPQRTTPPTSRAIPSPAAYLIPELFDVIPLRPATIHLHSNIPAAAAGRNNRVVIFDNNARPSVTPSRSVDRRLGFSSQFARTKKAVNCMHAAGTSVYAIPAKARTMGDVVNRTAATNPAKSPNSRRVQRKTTTAVITKKGRIAERARERFRK